ncbi:MAG: hypothetical protein JWO31_935 [Phycisphaerales bacterium]|nr:hypothetical protein [Phycisphaerales bacterium]
MIPHRYRHFRAELTLLVTGRRRDARAVAGVEVGPWFVGVAAWPFHWQLTTARAGEHSHVFLGPLHLHVRRPVTYQEILERRKAADEADDQ